jgi:hypothetical protein
MKWNWIYPMPLHNVNSERMWFQYWIRKCINSIISISKVWKFSFCKSLSVKKKIANFYWIEETWFQFNLKIQFRIIALLRRKVKLDILCLDKKKRLAWLFKEGREKRNRWKDRNFVENQEALIWTMFFQWGFKPLEYLDDSQINSFESYHDHLLLLKDEYHEFNHQMNWNQGIRVLLMTWRKIREWWRN